VCEGEKTEPNYFVSFPVPKEVITVRGIGAHTVRLVQRAIDLRDADPEAYDEVWCVLDRNSFPPERFNQALALAQRAGIKVAYSNEAFELWYLLHFHFYSTAVPRADYMTKLDGLLGHPYKKNSGTLYEELEDRQQIAIANARRLLALYEPCNPSQDNPSTTVHLLVEELLKYSR
jgi:hypothetical protein